MIINYGRRRGGGGREEKRLSQLAGIDWRSQWLGNILTSPPAVNSP